MTRDEAIQQMADGVTLFSEALGVIEGLEGDAELTTLHALAARLGWRLEAKLGVGSGTIVRTFDGDPKPTP